MGGLTRNINYWWDYFRQMFKIKTFYITGTITLGNGRQEVSVPTDLPCPQRVFLSVEEPEQGITVCIGDLNWVASVVQENGFTIYADIKSNSCVVTYVVEYERDHVKF